MGCCDDNNAKHACPECQIGTFTRNHYFTGKLLVERDFNDEQRYYMDKLRHHHQRLHGWGVVCGLKVKQHNTEVCRNRYVYIEPGTAVDCCGREIVLREKECVDITRFKAIKDLIDKKDTAKHTLQICISYKECPNEEIPVLYDECGCDENRCAPNRILESYKIDVIVRERTKPDVEPPDLKPPKGGVRAEVAAVEGLAARLAKDPLWNRREEGKRIPCGELFWKDLDGCPECDEGNCVVLASIENYSPGFKLLDQSDTQDQARDAADTIARIDNKNGRQLLPSTQTLKEVIDCLLAYGTGGTQGPAGPQGPAGTNGSQWLHGNGAPSAGTGNDGDYYLDTVTDDVFHKTVGSWTNVGNIKGSPGSAGADGSTWFNASGVPGVSIGVDGDYYLDVSNGDVYRRSSVSWSRVGNIKGPKGDNGADGEGLEKDLTQIVALSWTHGATGNKLAEIFDEQGKLFGKGVVIEFSDKVKVSEIDAEHVFQVLVEHDKNLRASGVICRCAVLGNVVPVEVTQKDQSRRINQAKKTKSPAKAAAFIFDSKTQIGKLINAGNIQLWVLLRGDFVIDYREDNNGKEIPGKAIDAEFVRAELPTGDRPANNRFGIQGGLFESWFTIEKGR